MIIINPHIPVVMFHSLTYSAGDNFYLAFRTEYFVEVVRKLNDLGYRFITIEDIIYKNFDKKDKNVCFSFDDGFADNYDVLFPILKYFNIAVSIFPAMDFIGEGFNAGKKEMGQYLRQSLTISNIKEMHESGLIDFQGHSATHTWYPISGKVVGKYHKSDIEKFCWIQWNLFKRAKKSLIEKQNLYDLAKEGFVIFENSRALNSRRFFPQKNEFDFKDLDVGMKVDGHYETFDEQKSRYEDDIYNAKIELENLLSKKLSFFCWPGGELDELSYGVFSQSGFSACSVPSNAAKQHRAEQIFDKDQAVINRIGAGCNYKNMDLGPDALLYKITHYYSPLLRKMKIRLRYLRQATGRGAR